MIRVTVEMLPGGNEERKYHLGTAYIANDGETSANTNGSRGSYEVVLSKRGQPESIWKAGRVFNFPRKRLLMWDLLYRALKETVGDRK